MSIAKAIKTIKIKTVTKYVTTDGCHWESRKVANGWQKGLNEEARRVLRGERKVKPAKVAPTVKRASHGKGGNVGVTPEKRRAIAAFSKKYNISISASTTLVSMNRLLWALASNPKAIKEFSELIATP